MKKYFARSLSIVLVVLMALSVCVGKSVNVAAASESAMNFSDVVQDKWYYGDIEYVFTKALMNGVSASAFEPNSPCTRGMLVTILYRLEGSPFVSQCPFTDVPSGQYYTKATTWAENNGIVTGYGDGRFGPMDNVTRQQLATIFCRYSKYIGGYVEYNQDISKFSDSGSISSYAIEGVKWAYHEGIIKGMTETTFAPAKDATRAQIAAMLHRFCDNFNGFHRVTYKWNSGDGKTYLAQMVKDSEIVPKPADPSRLGYKMTGWYLDAGATQRYMFTEKITQNLTLYAGWESVDSTLLESKYNFDKNPLINNKGQSNTTYMPGYNIDETGFVKSGTNLSDLKGKTLAFFTANDKASFTYKNNKGEIIDEWSWFKTLKSELGITIKYTVSSGMETLNKTREYMLAGKQLDIIHTNSDVFINAAMLSRSLDGVVNYDGATKSQGICTKTMNSCRWQNTPRVVAPLGTVDVLWYNQTLSQELNMSDPRTSWKSGQWNFDSFKRYMLSAPPKTNNNSILTAFAQPKSISPVIWTATNGLNIFAVDWDYVKPALINNWDNSGVLEVLEDFSGLMSQCTVSGSQDDLQKLYQGTLLMAGSMNQCLYNVSEYAKKIQLNWVPYPKYISGSGIDVSAYNGTFMMLPKKTAKPDNVNIALKFMELWANRYTEAVFDSLSTFEYYNFSDSQRKEYFDYAVKNAVYLVGTTSFNNDNYMDSFYNCFTGDPNYDVKDEMALISQQVKSSIIESLKWGSAVN